MTRLAAIILSSLLLSLSARAAGNPTTVSASSSRVGWYIPVGLVAMNRKPMSAALSAQGYPELPLLANTLGIGVKLNRDRLMLGLESSVLLASARSESERSVWLTGLQVEAQAGFSVLRGESWSLSPVIGVGLARSSYRLEQAGPNERQTLSSAVANPSRVELENLAGFGSAALQLDYVVNAPSDKQNGTSVALQVGYSFSPTALTGPLSVDSRPLLESPLAGFSGAFVRVSSCFDAGAI